MLTQTRTGLVAESLLDGKRISVGLRHNVSLLSEISIFTLQDEVPLREVFLKIQAKEEGKPSGISPKASKDELEEYFFEILPEYDEDRVYTSHISKIIKWYNLLVDKGITDFSDSEDQTDEPDGSPESDETTHPEEPDSTEGGLDKKEEE